MVDDLIAPYAQIAEEGGPIIVFIFLLSILLYATILRALQITSATSAPYGQIKLEKKSLLDARDLNAYWKNLQAKVGGFADDTQKTISYLVFARKRINRTITSKLLHIKIATAAAPLLGLLGTITGMIQTFTALSARSGADTSSMIASGISKALLTTNAGLVVAIPAIFLTFLIKYRLKRTLTIFGALETNLLNVAIRSEKPTP